jgi:flagellar basal-body rod protein FlgF/flagellar basal-body rod protein FlgG
MDSGLYAAYTGLLARTQALDTAANNLANAGTAGFRAEKDFFRGVMVDNLGGIVGDSQVGSAVNSFGILGGNRLDFSQGQIAATGNPLDLALEGDGFFGLQTGSGVVYTRQGNFLRSAAGVLEDGAGDPVLDAQQRPIMIPTGAVAVSSDGTISVATAAGSTVVGQVGVFTFTDKRGMTANGANRLAGPVGVKATVGTATVRQGAVEGSNQDAVQGTMELMLAQRQAEMMQRAMSVFNTDFDKVAAEELPKV